MHGMVSSSRKAERRGKLRWGVLKILVEHNEQPKEFFKFYCVKTLSNLHLTYI